MTSPYDTLVGKDPVLLSGELRQLRGALPITIARATEWLDAQFASERKTLERRDLGLIYKTVTAYGLLGRHNDADSLLDWVSANAIAPSNDLYIADVEPNMGVYRQSWILRQAVDSGHELANDPAIKQRMLQYQSPAGPVWDSIGDDAAQPEGGDTFTVASTCGFGLWALRSGEIAAGVAAARWIVDLVNANAADIVAGSFYFTADSAANPVRGFARGAEFGHVVQVSPTMQPTWVLGIAMAFLAETLDELASNPGRFELQADHVDRAARALAAFQDRMPLETYFSWNSCKIAWSVGRMLEIWIRRGLADPELLDQLYRAGRRTYLHTFLGTRLADGGWGHDFYPLSSTAPETQLDQRTLYGASAVPSISEWEAYRGEGEVVGIDPIEISAENLVMLLHYANGIDVLSAHLASQETTVVIGGSNE